MLLAVEEEEGDLVASKPRTPTFRLPAHLLRILTKKVGVVVEVEGKKLYKCGRKKLI